MSLRLQKYYFNIYIALNFLLLLGAFLFERPQMPRKLYILLLILGYGILMLILKLSYQKKRIKTAKLIFILLFFLSVLMRICSKFAINYFFLFIQFIWIFTVGFMLMGKKGIFFQLLNLGYIGYIFADVLMEHQETVYVIQGINFLLMAILIMGLSYFTAKSIKRQTEKELVLLELLKAHEALMDYAQEVEALTVYKERQRIAREVHDALGHRLTSLMMQLELLGAEIPLAKRQTLLGAYKSAKEALRDTRLLVSTLNETGLFNTSDIKKLIQEATEKGGVEITYQEDMPRDTPEGVLKLFFYTVREMLTNAQKHAHAKHIKITMAYCSPNYRFHFENDGQIPEVWEEGFGLTAIRKHGEQEGAVVHIHSTRESFQLDLIKEEGQ